MQFNMLTLILLFVAALPFATPLAGKDGVGRLPALGWNSWNTFACDVTQEHVLMAATQFGNLGLQVSNIKRH